jgi:hypothetical protein
MAGIAAEKEKGYGLLHQGSPFLTAEIREANNRVCKLAILGMQVPTGNPIGLNLITTKYDNENWDLTKLKIEQVIRVFFALVAEGAAVGVGYNLFVPK